MNPKCDHTLYHADRQGRLQGSWAEELVLDRHLGERVRIVCGSCGKFYGYLRDGASRATQKSVAVEMQQAAEIAPQADKSQSAAEPSGHVADEPKTAQLNTKLRHGGIDYKQLRQIVSMADVLELIGYQPTAKLGDQLRGPCPVHGSTSKRSRSFSVDLRGGRFQCFKCHAKGNQLDLYVAITEMPLYEAALDLCDKMQIEPPWSA